MKNPFDFANPVHDPGLFAGRARELVEVDYYLDLAGSQKGIGLAVIGERTCGKTSLLNMAHERAAQRSFLVARLDLTSADVTSESAFLKSLYEALFMAAKQAGAWGDKTHEVNAAFRDAMSSGKGEALRGFCDLAFPQAVAASAGGLVENFPPRLIVDDLAQLRLSFRAGPRSGIALLMDEGDHLTHLPIALEKLRFVMSTATEFLVVIAGTTNMLGSMDNVFAPIVRQFKRVALKPFISPSETRQCLLQRLKRVDREGLLSQEAYHDLHQLAQGHPYEAQLVAHYAYRRYVERPSDGFAITMSVLNEVLAQVERFRESDHNAFAATLRKYDREELHRLTQLIAFPKLSLQDLARVEVAVREAGRVKERINARRRELKGWADRFQRDKMIRNLGGNSGYELNGDQFDRLYAKLLAQTKRVPLRVDERPLVELSEEEAARALQDGCEGRGYPALILEELPEGEGERPEGEDDFAFVQTRYMEVLAELRRRIRSWGFRERTARVREAIDEGRPVERTTWAPSFLAEVGRCSVRSIGVGGMPTARVRLWNADEQKEREIWLQPAKCRTTRDQWEACVESVIKEHRPGLEALGWGAAILECTLEASSDLEKVLVEVQRNGWDAVRDEVLSELSGVTVSLYVDDRPTEALRLAELGKQYSSEADRWRHENNVGYMLLREGKLEAAIELLERSDAGSVNYCDLPQYNLAVCYALQGDVARAQQMLRDLESRLGSERIQEEYATVLFVLRADKGVLNIEEEKRIALREAVSRSLHAL